MKRGRALRYENEWTHLKDQVRRESSVVWIERTMKNPQSSSKKPNFRDLFFVFVFAETNRKNARRDENMCTCNRTWQLCVAVPRTCCSSCMMTSTAMLRMPSLVCGLSDFKCVMHMRPNSLSASLISRIRILILGVRSGVEGKKKRGCVKWGWRMGWR